MEDKHEIKINNFIPVTELNKTKLEINDIKNIIYGNIPEEKDNILLIETAAELLKKILSAEDNDNEIAFLNVSKYFESNVKEGLKIPKASSKKKILVCLNNMWNALQSANKKESFEFDISGFVAWLLPSLIEESLLMNRKNKVNYILEKIALWNDYLDKISLLDFIFNSQTFCQDKIFNNKKIVFAVAMSLFKDLKPEIDVTKFLKIVLFIKLSDNFQNGMKDELYKYRKSLVIPSRFPIWAEENLGWEAPASYTFKAILKQVKIPLILQILYPSGKGKGDQGNTKTSINKYKDLNKKDIVNKKIKDLKNIPNGNKKLSEKNKSLVVNKNLNYFQNMSGELNVDKCNNLSKGSKNLNEKTPLKVRKLNLKKANKLHHDKQLFKEKDIDCFKTPTFNKNLEPNSTDKGKVKPNPQNKTEAKLARELINCDVMKYSVSVYDELIKRKTLNKAKLFNKEDMWVKTPLPSNSGKNSLNNSFCVIGSDWVIEKLPKRKRKNSVEANPKRLKLSSHNELKIAKSSIDLKKLSKESMNEQDTVNSALAHKNNGFEITRLQRTNKKHEDKGTKKKTVQNNIEVMKSLSNIKSNSSNTSEIVTPKRIYACDNVLQSSVKKLKTNDKISSVKSAKEISNTSQFQQAKKSIGKMKKEMKENSKSTTNVDISQTNFDKKSVSVNDQNEYKNPVTHSCHSISLKPSKSIKNNLNKKKETTTSIHLNPTKKHCETKRIKKLRLNRNFKEKNKSVTRTPSNDTLVCTFNESKIISLKDYDCRKKSKKSDKNKSVTRTPSNNTLGCTFNKPKMISLKGYEKSKKSDKNKSVTRTPSNDTLGGCTFNKPKIISLKDYDCHKKSDKVETINNDKCIDKFTSNGSKIISLKEYYCRKNSKKSDKVETINNDKCIDKFTSNGSKIISLKESYCHKNSKKSDKVETINNDKCTSNESKIISLKEYYCRKNSKKSDKVETINNDKCTSNESKIISLKEYYCRKNSKKSDKVETINNDKCTSNESKIISLKEYYCRKNSKKSDKVEIINNDKCIEKIEEVKHSEASTLSNTKKEVQEDDSDLEIVGEEMGDTDLKEKELNESSDIDEASGSDGDLIPCDENNYMFTTEETKVYHQYLLNEVKERREERIREKVNQILSSSESKIDEIENLEKENMSNSESKKDKIKSVEKENMLNENLVVEKENILHGDIIDSLYKQNFTSQPSKDLIIGKASIQSNGDALTSLKTVPDINDDELYGKDDCDGLEVIFETIRKDTGKNASELSYKHHLSVKEEIDSETDVSQIKAKKSKVKSVSSEDFVSEIFNLYKHKKHNESDNNIEVHELNEKGVTKPSVSEEILSRLGVDTDVILSNDCETIAGDVSNEELKNEVNLNATTSLESDNDDCKLELDNLDSDSSEGYDIEKLNNSSHHTHSERESTVIDSEIKNNQSISNGDEIDLEEKSSINSEVKSVNRSYINTKLLEKITAEFNFSNSSHKNTDSSNIEKLKDQIITLDNREVNNADDENKADSDSFHSVSSLNKNKNDEQLNKDLHSIDFDTVSLRATKSSRKDESSEKLNKTIELIDILGDSSETFKDQSNVHREITIKEIEATSASNENEACNIADSFKSMGSLDNRTEKVDKSEDECTILDTYLEVEEIDREKVKKENQSEVFENQSFKNIENVENEIDICSDSEDFPLKIGQISDGTPNSIDEISINTEKMFPYRKALNFNESNSDFEANVCYKDKNSSTSEAEVLNESYIDSDVSAPIHLAEPHIRVCSLENKENIVNNEQKEIEMVAGSSNSINVGLIVNSPIHTTYLSSKRKSIGKKRSSLEGSLINNSLTPLKVSSAALSNEIIISPDISDEENTPKTQNAHTDNDDIANVISDDHTLQSNEEEQALDSDFQNSDDITSTLQLSLSSRKISNSLDNIKNISNQNISSPRTSDASSKISPKKRSKSSKVFSNSPMTSTPSSNDKFNINKSSNCTMGEIESSPNRNQINDINDEAENCSSVGKVKNMSIQDIRSLSSSQLSSDDSAKLSPKTRSKSKIFSREKFNESKSPTNCTKEKIEASRYRNQINNMNDETGNSFSVGKVTNKSIQDIRSLSSSQLSSDDSAKLSPKTRSKSKILSNEKFNVLKSPTNLTKEEIELSPNRNQINNINDEAENCSSVGKVKNMSIRDMSLSSQLSSDSSAQLSPKARSKAEIFSNEKFNLSKSPTNCTKEEIELSPNRNDVSENISSLVKVENISIQDNRSPSASQLYSDGSINLSPKTRSLPKSFSSSPLILTPCTNEKYIVSKSSKNCTEDEIELSPNRSKINHINDDEAKNISSSVGIESHCETNNENENKNTPRRSPRLHVKCAYEKNASEQNLKSKSHSPENYTNKSPNESESLESEKRDEVFSPPKKNRYLLRRLCAKPDLEALLSSPRQRRNSSSSTKSANETSKSVPDSPIPTRKRRNSASGSLTPVRRSRRLSGLEISSIPEI